MKILITGATGMVGKSVALACLEDTSVTEVLLINRSSAELHHPKLKEILIDSFMELPKHAEFFKGIDGCYHCMGVSAVGLSEEKYHQITFEYTKILADLVFEQSPQAVFTYVSGVGTDSTEQGSVMWSRVKGKTENYILNKGFKDAYAFRPGAILPPKGVKSKTGWYNALYVILRPFFPLMAKMESVVTGMAVGKAMLHVTQSPSETKILDPRDINRLSNT